MASALAYSWSVADVAWSDRVEAAEWIRERLDSWEHFDAGSVIPRGFQSYLRVLHPAQDQGRSVRWAEVATWSGLPLHRLAQFHSVALALDARPTPKPFTASPMLGSLDWDDTEALVRVLREHTSTPERCYFCVWDGRGWNTAVALTLPGQASPNKLPDPVSVAVRSGPRVRMPQRDYLLYEGPIEAALADIGGWGQTPQLWWPKDRAWCVASEIDLAWSYVGGSARLTGQLSDERLEVLPADTDDQISWAEPWIEERAKEAAQRLREAGEVMIETGVGLYRAKLTFRRLRTPLFEDRAEYGYGYSSRGPSPLQDTAGDDDLVRHLVDGLITLVR